MKKTDVSVPVYCHVKRPEWGLSLLAWERAERRGYYFEDGVLRVIAQPYYHHMQIQQVEQADLSNTFRQQISQMTKAKASGLLDPGHDASLVFSVAEQAQLLVGQFPDGFSGEAWRQRHRGNRASRQLKRHRDPALAQASQVLDPERIAHAIAEHRHAELWQEVGRLLQSTDLVPLPEVKALQRRAPEATRTLTLALAGLLRSEPSEEAVQGFETRLSTFVNELQSLLQSAPSWPLVTSLLALYFPSTHLCVHPTSLRQQLQWMGEKTLRSKKPNPGDYERARTAAKKLFEELDQLGLAPADLLDIHDFVRTLTTPSAKKRLEALRLSEGRPKQATAKQADEAPPKARAASDQEAA